MTDTARDAAIKRLSINADAMELSPQARETLQIARDDIRRMAGLRELCGYVEDGSCQPVTISQDDATRSWVVSVNDRPYVHGDTFDAAIDAALIRAQLPENDG